MSAELRFAAAADLAAALRRAAEAHGRHEAVLGHYDEAWPDWYAEYMLSDPATARTAPGAGPSGSSSP